MMDDMYMLRYKRTGTSGWYYLAPLRQGQSGLEDRVSMAETTDRAANGQRRPYKVEVVRMTVAETVWEGKADEPIQGPDLGPENPTDGGPVGNPVRTTHDPVGTNGAESS